MAHFIEPLATEQLWYWLETEKNWRVDSEVDTGNGRIDLACETPDGQYVGIELKAGSGLSWGAQLSEQVWRYIDSGTFDAVYFASPSVEQVEERIKNESVEPLIPVISQASRKLRAGVQADHFTADEALAAIEAEVQPEILSYEFSGGRRTVRSYIRRHLEQRTERSLDPVSIEAGIREISRSVLPPELGVIKVPLPLQGGYLRSPRMALTPGEIQKPTIVRKAQQISQTTTPAFSRTEEPWVRHAVWTQFGGIPEGSIPNVMESERADRPIDLVAFEEHWDPTKVLETNTGAVIGVEAKGESSFSPANIVTQLTEFLETDSFSKLYLAVSESLQTQAIDLLANHDQLESVGILCVDTAGNITTVREASELTLQHDGFKHQTNLYKTGYANIRIPNSRDVSSLFILSEWRDPLTDDSGEPVVWDYDPRETDAIISDIDQLTVSEPDKLREPLKEQSYNASTARAYLFTGYSAAPYVTGPGESDESQREPKYGYVRLSVTDFETTDGKYALDLHFGAGSWEGGYICLVGDQVEALISLLSSLEHVPRGSIPGQGQFIDLEEFRWEYGNNYEFKLGSEENSEQLLTLNIEATQTEDGVGATLRLGETLVQGVEVTMTETQRIDFLRTLRIMRYGRISELPGGGSGYQRVGSDGTDTWDRGTDIEEQHNPTELANPPREQPSSEPTEPNNSVSNSRTSENDDTQEGSEGLFDSVRSWLN